MNDKKKYSIDIDSLGKDWNSQRVQINSRLEDNKHKRRWSWKFVLASVVAIAVISVFIVRPLIKTHIADETIQDQQYVEEIIFDNDIPESLYVMNSFDEEGEFESMTEYIVPSYDGGEDL